MAEKDRVIESAAEVTKFDITLLAIQTRGWAGSLFRKLSRNDGDIVNIYNNFIESFYMLFIAFKYNAIETDKAGDWKKKMKLYDEFFYKEILENQAFIPHTALKLFDCFMDDMVANGIYDLTVGEFRGRHD